MRHRARGGRFGTEKGVIFVSITHAPPIHVRRRRINPWLISVIAFAAGVVALSTWMLVDRATTSEPAAARIVDELNAAVNAGDADAVRALFAPDAVFQVSTGEQITGLDNVVNAVLIPHAVHVRLERVAPVSTEGNAAATFTGLSNGSEGVELGVFLFEDGKIARMWVYDEGYR